MKVGQFDWGGDLLKCNEGVYTTLNRKAICFSSYYNRFLKSDWYTYKQIKGVITDYNDPVIS